MSDALTLSGRCLRLSRRNTEALLTSLMLPIMLMLLFVYLFGGAIRTGTEYVTYVVPGVLLLCAGYGASITAVSVPRHVERARRPPPLARRGRRRVPRRARRRERRAQRRVDGRRPRRRHPHRLPADATPLEWVAAAGMLALFVVALSWFAALIGLLARTPEGASGFTFFVMFLPYPSSAFVPIATMPAWIHGFAAHQPVTPVIETIRSLLLGTPAGTNPVQAVAWCSAILVASVALAGVLFRRRTA